MRMTAVLRADTVDGHFLDVLERDDLDEHHQSYCVFRDGAPSFSDAETQLAVWGLEPAGMWSPDLNADREMWTCALQTAVGQ